MVRKHVFLGLTILLPIVLTLWIVNAVFQWATAPFLDMTERALASAGITLPSLFGISHDRILIHASQGLVAIVMFLAIFLIGSIGHSYLFSTVTALCSAGIRKVPLIGGIYTTTHDFFNALPNKKTDAFSTVALVPFPCSSCFTLGLVSKEGLSASHLISVFIPAAPNPTHGYILVFDRSDVIPITMTVEEAFRSIVSCGALLPKAEIQAKYSPQRSSLT